VNLDEIAKDTIKVTVKYFIPTVSSEEVCDLLCQSILHIFI